MHAGFRALRSAMPMNLGRNHPLAGGVPEDVAEDIARIEALWREGTQATPFLWGATMGMADAMYAPVVARLLSYTPPLSDGTLAYCRAVRAHPLVARWYDDAAAEPAEWHLAKYEAVA